MVIRGEWHLGAVHAMHLPDCPQGRISSLVAVPVLLNSAAESGGHQQYILWLIWRLIWKLIIPEWVFLGLQFHRKYIVLIEFCFKITET